MIAALADLRRLHQIASVLTRHGFEEIADRLLARSPGRVSRRLLAGVRTPGEEEQAKLPPEQRFRRVLEDLGPTFIKLGQVLSTRHDLLPVAYIRELARLQDRVEPLPFEQIRQQIEEGLQRPCDEVFAEIEPEPIATASIAQVHRGTLADGTGVVIKVQRPGTSQTIASDLDVLYGVARMLAATVEEARAYDPVGIVSSFEQALREELDYTLEARHMEEFRKNYASVDWLDIPRFYPQASCRTVLTQQRIRGIRLHELPPDAASRALITDRMMQAAYKMIFEDGLFHADPHPGNFFVLEDNRLALIDFGLVGRVSSQMRETLIQLALGITTRDVASLARLFYRLGTGGERISLSAFRREIEELIDRYLGLKLEDIETASLIRDLFEVAVRYRIRVPSSYALMVKASATIEGVVRWLAPDLDLLAATRPYAQKLLAERYGPQELSMRAVKLGLSLGGLIQDLPLEVEQILMDLESGQLSLHVESEVVRELGDRMNALGSRIFLGMIAAGTLVATALVLTQFPVEVLGEQGPLIRAWTVALLVVLGLSTVGSLFFVATTWHLLSTRFSRVRLSPIFSVWRWLSRRKAPKKPEVEPVELPGPTGKKTSRPPGDRARPR